MSLRHLWFFSILSVTSLHADYFSQFAEARNVLDHAQLGWAIRPYPIALKMFGFVKAEGMFDTRQNFTIRSGQLLYFPLEKLPDVNGADINGRGDFDEYAIQSRLDLAGVGPDIGCMKSNFLIEAEFFGRTDPTVEEFDLRLGYLELTSDHLDFLAGQHFHPICYPFESPDTISYNCGIPTAPFALCPQFKLTYHDERYECLAAAVGFLGDRPFGLAGGTDKVFRDSMMPDFYFQMRLKENEDNYIGIGFDVNRLVPRLVTTLGYKEVNSLVAASTQVFGRIDSEKFTVYSKLMYYQDGAIFELIGGIAVRTIDPLTGTATYVPLRTLAWHADFIWKGTIEPGFFVGVAKNLGAGTTIVTSAEDQVLVYGIGTNIDIVFRVSPRIRYYISSFIIGLEYEYTQASYGIINNRGSVVDTVAVANNRLLFATYYVF